MDTQEQIEAMETLAEQLGDIANSYQALIEKMARAQMELDGVDELADISERLDGPFKHVSNDHEAISSLVDDVQMKINQLGMEDS